MSKDAEVYKLGAQKAAMYKAQRDVFDTAVNQIDDYFEYRAESKIDKLTVQCILSRLTVELAKIELKEMRGD